MENQCRNGSKKALKIEEYRSLGVPGLDFLRFLCILGDVEKIYVFRCRFSAAKIYKNRASERQGVAKVTSQLRWCEAFGPEGSLYSKKEALF